MEVADPLETTSSSGTWFNFRAKTNCKINSRKVIFPKISNQLQVPFPIRIFLILPDCYKKSCHAKKNLQRIFYERNSWQLMALCGGNCLSRLLLNISFAPFFVLLCSTLFCVSDKCFMFCERSGGSFLEEEVFAMDGDLEEYIAFDYNRWIDLRNIHLNFIVLWTWVED